MSTKNAARPSWDEYFNGLATMISTRATCPRKSVGCVIVRDRQILCTGYNGSPPGLSHCNDVGCHIVDNHCVRTIHAEANAVAQAARNGTSLKGATAYVTVTPCHTCSKLLASAGIVSIIWTGDYP